ncbi:MAG: winged helix-turn-helix domain-containing protein, partial [Candidatus Sericytochromatia bacterium]|nr:winged helix-turn-helix domain-containing protein [Candidatus Tanganyikabacteria bacterium]
HPGAAAPPAEPAADMAPVRAIQPGVLEIRCLGPFQLVSAGRVILPEAFKRRRSLTVLKILLARYGKPVHREELMEMLWPEQHPEESRKLLNSAIHYLRRSLAPAGEAGREAFILRDGESYAFDVTAAHRIDTVEFETSVREAARLESRDDAAGAAAACRQAIALYRGDFLEEDRWSDWCALEREYFRERLLSLLRTATDLHVAIGDLGAAEACCRRALQVDPVLEDVHRKLMAVLWHAGRRAEALKQFEECREVLVRELGIEPLAETRALARSISEAEATDLTF